MPSFFISNNPLSKEVAQQKLRAARAAAARAAKAAKREAAKAAAEKAERAAKRAERKSAREAQKAMQQAQAEAAERATQARIQTDTEAYTRWSNRSKIEQAARTIVDEMPAISEEDVVEHALVGGYSPKVARKRLERQRLGHAMGQARKNASDNIIPLSHTQQEIVRKRAIDFDNRVEALKMEKAGKLPKGTVRNAPRVTPGAIVTPGARVTPGAKVAASKVDDAAGLSLKKVAAAAGPMAKTVLGLAAIGGVATMAYLSSRDHGRPNSELYRY